VRVLLTENTATVPIPSLRHVSKILQAISPRFATSTFDGSDMSTPALRRGL